MRRLFLILVAVCMILTTVPVMAQRSDIEKIQDKDTVFSDISTHWAKDIINGMADKGLIKGMGNGKFMPDNQIKRSEFAVALHKALNITMAYIKATDIKEFFSDADNDDWYASPLYDLAILNIIDDRGEFRPDSLITREEMVHYLINGYRYKLGNEAGEPDEGENNFKDSKSIGPKFLKNVNWAVKLGFIRGRGANLFVPKGNTTRAEAMAVLERLLTELERLAKDIDDIKDGAKVKIETGFEKDGNIITMRLKIENNSDKDITINHSSTQKFDFSILDSKKDILYTWSMDKTFAMMLTETVVEAGKSVEFVEKLEADSFESLTDAAYLKGFITGTSESFKIDEQGYETKLKTEDTQLVVESGFKKGDKVFEMKLKLTNKSEDKITINHTSSQKYDFKLLDEEKEILYTWSADKLFMMALSDTVVNPGETIEFKEELDMEAYRDTVVKAKYLKAFITGSSKDVDIDNDGYVTEIK
ncbi:MAG: S-layer protein [Clostridiaceae bacterium]|nr:S-layer protein [Clostridiaceae bacterium]